MWLSAQLADAPTLSLDGDQSDCDDHEGQKTTNWGFENHLGAEKSS